MAMKFIVWLALVAIVVGLVMLLWNWLMPAVFAGARTIDYWQTLGLLVLSRVFFGGGHGRWKGRRRWENLSAEEREKLAQYGKRGRGGDCGWRKEAPAAGDAAP
jgi:hypothetical protein